MSANIKQRINWVENELDQLRKRHAEWHPADARTLENWTKQVHKLKQQIEYNNQPTIQELVRYLLKGIKEINQLLLNDKKLTTEERRMIMDKREMYQGMTDIFSPGEEAVAAWENELKYQKATYPQDSISSHYQS